MSEDIYAKPDLTKKVRFQKNEGANKEESDKNIKDEVDSVRIYDNYWAEGNSAPTVEDNTTDDQQQIDSIDVNSEKRSYVKTALLLMGVLCFLLLVTVIVLVSLILLSWRAERNLRTELQESYTDLERFNHNLTQWNRLLQDEKTNLTQWNRLLQDEKTNLTQWNRLLEDEKTKLTIDRDQLRAITTNLTKETEELHKKLLKIFLCPNGEWRFSNSWYFISNSRKHWADSKETCEKLDATLAIISTKEEQRFISSLNRRPMWIGLTDKEKENAWKWVNGDDVTTTYWNYGQPDNCESCGQEDCAEIDDDTNRLDNWNDLSCHRKIYFICEKRP